MQENTANTEISEISETKPSRDIRADYKKTCIRLGLMIILIFVFRFASTVLYSFIDDSLTGHGGALLDKLISFVFLDALPITASVILLRLPVKETAKKIYARPKYFGQAMGMFPAFYGCAVFINIITLLVRELFSDPVIKQSFATPEKFFSTDEFSAVLTFINMTIIAPIFEELWFRGIILEALRPYGNGVAIFISGLIFGLAHANFSQFFYAATLGVFFGYIAVSTKSIVTTTAMHALFNSFGATLILLMSRPPVKEFLRDMGKTGLGGDKSPEVIAYLVISAVMLMIAAVGFIIAIAKFTKIKKYKVPKVQTELSAPRRWGIFFTTAAVIVGFLLAFDTMTFRYSLRFLLWLSHGCPAVFPL